MWAGDVAKTLGKSRHSGARRQLRLEHLRRISRFLQRSQAKFPQAGKVPEKIVGTDRSAVRDHHDIGKCVVGGYVYRGKQVPGLNGKYLLPTMSQVHVMIYDEVGKKAAVERIEPKGKPVFSFCEDEAGEVYFMTTQGSCFVSERGDSRGEGREVKEKFIITIHSSILVCNCDAAAVDHRQRHDHRLLSSWSVLSTAVARRRPSTSRE